MKFYTVLFTITCKKTTLNNFEHSNRGNIKISLWYYIVFGFLDLQVDLQKVTKHFDIILTNTTEF